LPSVNPRRASCRMFNRFTPHFPAQNTHTFNTHTHTQSHAFKAERGTHAFKICTWSTAPSKALTWRAGRLGRSPWPSSRCDGAAALTFALMTPCRSSSSGTTVALSSVALSSSTESLRRTGRGGTLWKPRAASNSSSQVHSLFLSARKTRTPPARAAPCPRRAAVANAKECEACANAATAGSAATAHAAAMIAAASSSSIRRLSHYKPSAD
jgi:hypothetical protein